MEVDVKIRYQFPQVFEPGIVRYEERMCFVLVPHSVAIQANLNDERFVSNHQCIRVQEKSMQSLACQALDIAPVLFSRGARCGNLRSNAGDIESIPVGTVSRVSGAIRQL